MGTLFLLALAVAVGWVVSLKVHPFAPCRRCHRSGQNAGSNHKRWGNCGKCGGSGKRLRFGARMLARKD